MHNTRTYFPFSRYKTAQRKKCLCNGSSSSDKRELKPEGLRAASSKALSYLMPMALSLRHWPYVQD